MKKRRVKDGERYYYINALGNVACEADYHITIDNLRYKTGNYFHDKESATAMANKLRAVFKGADVIQTPSGAEIFDAAEGHVEACDEEGHPYSDKDDAKAAFVNGAEWLKSKIIK